MNRFWNVRGTPRMGLGFAALPVNAGSVVGGPGGIGVAAAAPAGSARVRQTSTTMMVGMRTRVGVFDSAASAGSSPPPRD